MLPGQANCERAIFEVKQLRGLKDHEHLYRALCSRLGLAAFICRHFHSLAAQDGHVEIRTTVGAFKIFPQGSTAVIKFLPRDKAFETHQLAAGDFQNVQKFAQGQIRLSPFAFDRVYGREGGENERWKEIPIKLAILTAALDHPQCIRFVTQTELEILETSREICKVVMRTFIRLVDEEPLEGTEAFEQWELIMTVFRQSRDADFVHPDSIRIITEVCGGICKLVCPDDNARGQVLSKVVDDFGEILDILRGEPTARSARVRGYLKEFFERYGLPFVCCFVAQALIASTNCSIFLTISVASPQLWLEFLTGPEVDVFVE
jgi:hypothetical protein